MERDSRGGRPIGTFRSVTPQKEHFRLECREMHVDGIKCVTKTRAACLIALCAFIARAGCSWLQSRATAICKAKGKHLMDVAVDRNDAEKRVMDGARLLILHDDVFFIYHSLKAAADSRWGVFSIRAL